MLHDITTVASAALVEVFPRVVGVTIYRLLSLNIFLLPLEAMPARVWRSWSSWGFISVWNLWEMAVGIEMSVFI